MGMSIESAPAAHLDQPDGPSMPGVSRLIRIELGGRARHARVKTMLAAYATQATRPDDAYQARTTMHELTAAIDNGWNPTQQRKHTIHIDNARDQPALTAWRRIW